MKLLVRSCIALLTLLLGTFLFNGQVNAGQSIAKITDFQGNAVIQSGDDIMEIARVGQTLNEGDRIQTKDGTVQITFTDGAIMKVNPYTNALIQEREEESGFWIFKTKKIVRRITCFIGKLWFKSGSSNRKNYLQTPTAVCGLRGSDGDIGFDNLNTYLNMLSGKADVVGKVLRGFFENPGIDKATKSRIYRTMETAYNVKQSAGETGKTLDAAKAKVEALKVVKEAAEILKNNPDSTVKKIDGELASVTVDTFIANAVAKVAVEELKDTKQQLQKAVETAVSMEDAQKAKKALEETVKAVGEAQDKLATTGEAVAEAEAAANAFDLDKAKKVAEEAKKTVEKIKEIKQKVIEVIKKEEVATTIETTEATTVETTEAATTTEEATTSAEVTTTSTTTTTTTTTSEETTVSGSQ